MVDLITPLKAAVSGALVYFLVDTASTKRSVMSGGKLQIAATYIASLECTPPLPVLADQTRSPGLETPHELLRSFVKGTEDVREGDVFVYGGKEYPIRSCANVPEGSSAFLELVLEDQKV